MKVNPQQLKLARDLERKLAAAVAAKKALDEFERVTPGLVGPRLAFGQLDETQVNRWRERVNEIEAGTLSV